MTAYEAFCYGEIDVDNIIQLDQLPNPEVAVFPTDESYHIGGAAANTATWLAGLGFRVGLTGNVIGDDWLGRQLWGWLSERPGLDLSQMLIQKGAKTPLCRALVTPDGERSFLLFGADAKKVPLESSMLRGASYLALDLYGGPERLAAAKMARQAGIRTVIGDVIDPDHPVLPLTSIANNSGAFIRQRYPGRDLRQHAAQLQAISQGVIVITDGGREVLAVAPDGVAWTVKPPEVQPVDATGAGDAFRAGLMAGLLKGQDLPTSLRWGVAAGALKVGHIGAATTVPSLDEVRSLADTLSAKPA